MEKVQAWLKAHWKPFAIAFVAGIAVWFLFMRKNSSGATALSIPSPFGGGSASGSSSGSAPASTDTTGSTGAQAAAGPPSFMDWLKNTWNASYLPKGLTVQQWESNLVSKYSADTGAVIQDVPSTGLRTGATVPGYDWFKAQYSVGGWKPPANPSQVGGPIRGSGFRGGDIFPSAWGDSRPAAQRAASATNLPAAPLGTPVVPKQPTSMDVRNAPRRQTAIAQVARGNPPPTMPQSFSVPIREHLEKTRPVLTIQAVNSENQDAANPPSPQTPAATQAELASSDQKSTQPPPLAAATPNIARGRKRYGAQRVPAKPTQRWK